MLDAQQWKVEVTQLFQTSLARIQISARNIARGNPNAPTNLINFMDRTPELRGLCNMYKFKSTGWRNNSVSGFLGATGAGLILLFLGRTTGSEENEDELRIEGYYRTLRHVAWKKFFTQCWNCLKDGFKISLSCIRDWIGKVVKKCHDKFKRLRENWKLHRAAAKAPQSRRSPNGTDPRISDGIEM
jgi:hypothetical protein